MVGRYHARFEVSYTWLRLVPDMDADVVEKMSFVRHITYPSAFANLFQLL